MNNVLGQLITPEIIQIPDITISEVDNTWMKYGLQEQYLKWKGEDAGYKLIVKDGAIVTIPTTEYVLLPNEEAVSIADEVARDVGAIPFSEFTGEWYNKLSDHVITTGKTQNQVHALYAFERPVDIGGGDTIQIGFAIHNSIDRSMGFGAGLFTFRHACANMVFMGFKGTNMEFDERQTQAWMYNKHVGQFSPDREVLKKNIKSILSQGIDVLEMYKKMKDLELQEEMFNRLKAVLPDKYVPDSIMTKELVAEAPKVKTLWDGYNTITAAIWHNDKSDYQTKKVLFDKLHGTINRIMVPAR